MPSVRGGGGGEAGLGAPAQVAAAVCCTPVAGAGVLFAGLLGCLGHLWAPVSGRCVGPDAQEGVKGSTESGRQSQESRFSMSPLLL